MLYRVYTWLILQVCGRSGPTGTHENTCRPTERRALAQTAILAAASACLPTRQLSRQLSAYRAGGGSYGWTFGSFGSDSGRNVGTVMSIRFKDDMVGAALSQLHCPFSPFNTRRL